MRSTRSVQRAIVVAVVGFVSIIVASGPAGANVGVSTSLTVQMAVSVGQTGVPGSFTVFNTNTVPNQAEFNTITQLRLAPSCGSLPMTANLCPTADPGVFTLAPTATGAAGTACAGVNFNVSAPDASGVVTFTPPSPVVLAPPGGAPGSDRCTVNFSYSVLKVPTIDTNPGVPGVQTRTNLRAQVQSTSGLTGASQPSVEVTVTRAQPGMTTQASPSVPLGSAITDTATVTGVPGIAAPTGTVTFQVYGPNNAGCTGTPVSTSISPVVGGSAVSSPFVPTQPGVYRFVATYSGDANYNSRSSGCNDPGESVTVFPRRAVADFDGDGKTDFAVFRPSTGSWFADGAVSDLFRAFGVSTDIPVAADYDGDGKTDVAVFRPSTGVWFIERSTGGSQALPFGTTGDVPVPGDYDGDGLADRAVYRPSTGTWFIRPATAGPDVVVTFGASTDVPVPGDYDGDRKTDIAVFRPSTGRWFVRFSSGGDSSVVWGVSGDIPVPGDYDGDARTDAAVYRPSTGTWFVLRSSGGSTAQNWGVSTDIPAPGDYDGDGKTDLAVFRPSNGTWYVLGSAGSPLSRAWGASGDVPVALPPAIRAILPPP